MARAESPCDTESKVVDDHIAGGEKPIERLLSVLAGQVDRGRPVTAVAAEALHAPRITDQRFDLDDVDTQLGQQTTDVGCGDIGA
jgi:hypothetical protein